MGNRPEVAVILAAGMGTRLKSVFSDRPKGFVEIGGEGLIARSIRLLKARGIRAGFSILGGSGGDSVPLPAHLPECTSAS